MKKRNGRKQAEEKMNDKPEKYHSFIHFIHSVRISHIYGYTAASFSRNASKHAQIIIRYRERQK